MSTTGRLDRVNDFWFLLFLVSSPGFGWFAAAAQTGALPAAAWQEDLGFLVSTITAVHPMPFHRVTETSFREAVEKLHNEIPSLAPEAIATRMMQLTALLHDGSTPLGRWTRHRRN